MTMGRRAASQTVNAANAPSVVIWNGRSMVIAYQTYWTNQRLPRNQAFSCAKMRVCREQRRHQQAATSSIVAAAAAISV